MLNSWVIYPYQEHVRDVTFLSSPVCPLRVTVQDLPLTLEDTAQECDAPNTFYEGASVVGCCGAKTVACNLPISCVGGTLFFTNAPSGTVTTSYMDTVAWYDISRRVWLRQI